MYTDQCDNDNDDNENDDDKNQTNSWKDVGETLDISNNSNNNINNNSDNNEAAIDNNLDGGNNNDDDNDNASDSDNADCVICLSEAKTVVMFPCRHLCTCLSCSETLPLHKNKCPICRTDVNCLIQLPLSKVTTTHDSNSSNSNSSGDEVQSTSSC